MNELYIFIEINHLNDDLLKQIWHLCPRGIDPGLICTAQVSPVRACCPFSTHKISVGALCCTFSALDERSLQYWEAPSARQSRAGGCDREQFQFHVSFSLSDGASRWSLSTMASWCWWCFDEQGRFLFFGREDLLPLLEGDFLLWGVDWCCYDVSLLFLLYISKMFAARSAFKVAKPLLRRGYAEGVATDKLRLSLVLPHEVSQDSLFTIPQGD